MEKINFVNNSEPYLSAENLNQMQTNIEGAINGVVESGSNENGSWVKYADGTMICYAQKYINPTFSQDGSMYVCRNLAFNDFPQNFVGVPTITLNFVSVQSTRHIIITNSGTTNTNAGNVSLMTYWAATDANGNAHYIAIGKWK